MATASERVRPSAGEWLAIGRRVREEASRERLSLLAAGIAFWGTLSFFPMLLALVAAYGLVADPGQVAGQLASLTRPLPDTVARLLVDQLTSAVRTGRTGLSWHLALSLAGLLWTSSRAVQALMRGLNAVYGARETRGFLGTRLLALLLTLAAVVGVSILLAIAAAAPVVLGHVGLAGPARTAVAAGRWVVLVLFIATSLALLYRFVPAARLEPGWRSVGWGVGLAMPALLLVSVGLSIFVSNFGRYNETYGAVGAVVVLMLWLYLSSLVTLLGAEVNGALERHVNERGAMNGADSGRGRREPFTTSWEADMSTPARSVPMSPSNEADQEQLKVAAAEGRAYHEALKAMKEESGAIVKRAGDYLVAFVQEDAEGMYAWEDGRLVWREAPEEANGHIEIAVADAADGRFVPGLRITVTVGDRERTLFSTEVPFLWHPFLHHYGCNVQVPGEGTYRVQVHIEPPTFMRHDPVNGKRYAEPVEVTFEDVRFSPGRKPSPDAQPRQGETTYAHA